MIIRYCKDEIVQDSFPKNIKSCPKSHIEMFVLFSDHEKEVTRQCALTEKILSTFNDEWRMEAKQKLKDILIKNFGSQELVDEISNGVFGK